MRYINNTIEGDLIGVPLFHFNPDLTEKAKLQIATKIEHMDDVFNHLEQLNDSDSFEEAIKIIRKLKTCYKHYNQKRLENMWKADHIEVLTQQEL